MCLYAKRSQRMLIRDLDTFVSWLVLLVMCSSRMSYFCYGEKVLLGVCLYRKSVAVDHRPLDSVAIITAFIVCVCVYVE